MVLSVALLLEVCITQIVRMLLDDLQSFFEESDASVPHPPTNQGIGTDGAVPLYVT